MAVAIFDGQAREGRAALWIEALYAIGIGVMLCAACFEGLRLTPMGLALQAEGTGGWPFAYEIALLAVVALSLVRWHLDNWRLTSVQVMAIALVAAFYLPIFLAFFLYSPALASGFVGGGQLRLQLEIWLLATALLASPPGPLATRAGLVGIVVGAIPNAIFAIGIASQIVPPLYEPSYLPLGDGQFFFRPTGFFFHPGPCGLLCAAAFLVLFLARGRGWIRWPLMACFLAGLAVTVSRSTFIGLATTAALLLLSRSRLSARMRVILVLATFGVGLVGAVLFWDRLSAIDVARIGGLGDAVATWFAHPLGIAWGTFPVFSTFPPPHNLPVAALLYGGLVSFATAIGLYLWSIAEATRVAESLDDHRTASFIIVVVLVGALFEQYLQSALALLLVVFALSVIVGHYAAAAPVVVVAEPARRPAAFAPMRKVNDNL